MIPLSEAWIIHFATLNLSRAGLCLVIWLCGALGASAQGVGYSDRGGEGMSSGVTAGEKIEHVSGSLVHAGLCGPMSTIPVPPECMVRDFRDDFVDLPAIVAQRATAVECRLAATVKQEPRRRRIACEMCIMPKA